MPAVFAAALWILPGAVARHALSHLDGRASIGGVRAAPGLLLLADVDMPGLGFEADEAVIYWSMGVPVPSVDSILIPSCRVDLPPGRGRAGGGGGGGSDDMPLLVLGEARLTRAGSDTTVFSGRASLRSGSVEMSGLAHGPWGSASIEAGGVRGEVSFRADFHGCTGIPLFDPDLPSLITETGFSGSLQGTATDDSVHLEGTAAGTGGAAAATPFSLSYSERTSELTVATGLGGAETVADNILLSYEPSAWMSLDPEGEVRLTFEGGEPCRFDLEARMDSASVYSEHVAGDTVRFSCSVSASGTVEPGRLRVDSCLLSLGTMNLRASLEALTGDRDRLTARIWNDSIPGEAIASSIPASLLGPLAGTALEGSLGLDVRLSIDRQWPDSSDLSILVDAGGLSVVSCPVDVARLVGGGSCRMRDSWGNSRLIHLSRSANVEFVELSEMPPWFEPLLCCSEDGTFRSHSGFSAEHIRNSLVADVREGGFVRGASTLTMQLARNLFLSREKTLARKLQEVFLTWRLEETLSKDRILEIYANIVELGPDVFGFAEASLYYFGTGIRDLGVRETAFLVSILPGPRPYHRFFERGSVPDWWEGYLDILVESAERRGGVTHEEAALALGHAIRFN